MYDDDDDFDPILDNSPIRRTEPKNNIFTRIGKHLEIILLSAIGILVLLALLVFGFLWIRGGIDSFRNRVPTLIPTLEQTSSEAEFAVEVQRPTATFGPTATPPAAGGRFVSPGADARLSLNEPVQIELVASDPIGVRNVQILDNGQTIFSQQFNGEKEAVFSQQWVPLADGIHLLEALMTNREGTQTKIAEVSIRVIDFAFAEANAETLGRVEASVGSIRGLSLIRPVDPHLMGQAELKQYMRSFDYTPADGYEDMLVLAQFDFLERGYDLYEASIEFAGSNIAGFYNPDTDEFVIVSNDRNINALEEYIYAHELMHALQDQHFDLGDISSGDVELTSEESLALRALAEGEAELLETQYAQQFFSDQQRVEVFNIIQTLYRPTQYTIEPVPVLTAQFYFPYEQGAAFVQAAFERGGWAEVNRLWSDRPTSTEQILHPERYYAGDTPQAISIAPADQLLGDRWRMIRDDVLGEFYMRQYLGQQLSADDVNYGALGWGGDRYQVFLNDQQDSDTQNDQTVLIFKSGWDSPAEADHFGAAWGIYADAAYGESIGEPIPGSRCRQSADVVCSIRIGDEWLIVRAPSIDLAAQIMSNQ